MKGEPARGRTLFVYGTLLFPSILERLLGRQPLSSPGTAEGFAARTMPDATYPGMVRSPSDNVEGALLAELTAQELDLLDAYEGWPYQRVQIEVTLASGERVPAPAYVVEEHLVSESPWDKAVFTDRYLEDFLRNLDGGGSSAGRDQV